MTAAWTRWGQTPSRRRLTAIGGTATCSARSQAGAPACWATMWTLEPLQCTRWVCAHQDQPTAAQESGLCGCASIQASPFPFCLAAPPGCRAPQASKQPLPLHSKQSVACTQGMRPLWPAAPAGPAQPGASAVERAGCCCPAQTSKQPAHVPPATIASPYGFDCHLLCAIRDGLCFLLSWSTCTCVAGHLWPLSKCPLTHVHCMQTPGGGYGAAPTDGAAGGVPATGVAHYSPTSGTVPSGTAFQGNQVASDYPSGTSQHSAVPDGLAGSQTAGGRGVAAEGLTGPSTHQTGAGMGQSSGAALGGSNVAMPGAHAGGHLPALHADTPIISLSRCPWLLQA